MTEAWTLFAVGAVLLFAGTEWLARLVGGAAGAAGAGWLVAGPVARAAAGAVAVLAASLTAAIRGTTGGMALGCVVGGAVLTIGVGLGLAAVRRGLRGELPLLWVQLPVMMGATALVWFLSGDGKLNQTNGAVLVGAFALWAGYSAKAVRAVTRPGAAPAVGRASRALVLFALLAVVGGAQLVVGAGLDLQALLGLTEWTTGLTLVAAATAAPTVAAIVWAGWKGDGDAALATTAAANTTTLLLVLGVVCVVRPLEMSNSVAFRELPALGLSAVLLIPALLNNLKVSRYEGLTWLAAYAALVAWQLGAFPR